MRVTMIDVVIPAHSKDCETLDLCIEYLKLNVTDRINNIYVISKTKLTENALWVPEDSWDFSKEDVNEIISAYKEAPKNGLKTSIGKKKILDWSKELFEVSKKGLENRNELNSKKQNEVKYLDHIKNIIDTNSTNAEVIMTRYQKDKNFFTINEK